MFNARVCVFGQTNVRYIRSSPPSWTTAALPTHVLSAKFGSRPGLEPSARLSFCCTPLYL